MMPVTAVGPLFGSPVNWAQNPSSSLSSTPNSVANLPGSLSTPQGPNLNSELGWATGPVRLGGMRSISAVDGTTQSSQISASPAYGSGFSSPRGTSASTAPFADLITEAIGQVNQLESQAKSAVEGLMSGKGVDVHQAMIATEKAGMSFDLVLAVRNKALAAYQQVVGMQFYTG